MWRPISFSTPLSSRTLFLLVCQADAVDVAASTDHGILLRPFFRVSSVVRVPLYPSPSFMDDVVRVKRAFVVHCNSTL
jgi:hypothetical protein